MKIKRLFFVKTHLILAGLSLSIMTMFLITGALYTYGYKPSSHTIKHRVTEPQALKKDIVVLTDIALRELQKLGISPPITKPKMKRDKRWGVFKLVWSDENKRVSLRPSTRNNHVAVMKIKQYSWYSRLMSLHKGKGKDIFDIFTISAAIILFIVLLSGVLVGLMAQGLRRLTLYSVVSGMMLFVGMVTYVQFF